MRPTTKTLVVVLKSVLLLQAFVTGLLSAGHMGPESAGGIAASGARGVAVCVLGLLLFPLIVMLVVKLNVITGFMKPPWELPTFASNPLTQKNPLPIMHFFAFYSGTLGVGAAISMAWQGLAAIDGAMLGLIGAAAFYIALRRLVAAYPTIPPSGRAPLP